MAHVMIARPAASEYNPHYAGYVAAVPEGDLLETLESQIEDAVKLLKGVDDKKSRHRYAPDKWSVREVVGHLADSERVFAYRALRFARGDATPLPSFDENEWAKISNADARPLPDLVAELTVVRGASLALFRSFTDKEFARAGIASGNPITVRALAYIITGHERHHVRILRERYGI